MRILILGGTGAMGRFLVPMLDNGDNEIVITSRSSHEDRGAVHYVKGDAMELDFIKNLLASSSFDAIVDFMSYSSAQFRDRYELFLDHTRQYVFISSARVYAESKEPITEDTPRLLDVSQDKDFLATDEYALAKARSEDMLRASGRTNWTIFRPSITYGTERFQLGVLEKENWLYRALHGRSIVFSDDIAGKITAMTHGRDVAAAIAALIGKNEALGGTFHATGISLTWSEILRCYVDVLEKHGIKARVKMTPITQNISCWGRPVYQVIYCRYYDRSFDNTRISHFVDVDSFVSPLEGLSDCLGAFLKAPRFRNISWRLEAISDRIAGEWTPLSEISSFKDRFIYLLFRLHLGFLLTPAIRMRSLLKRG